LRHPLHSQKQEPRRWAGVLFFDDCDYRVTTGGFIAISAVQRSLNTTAPSCVYSLLRQVHGPGVYETGRAAT
jgi:hypothetical protein